MFNINGEIWKIHFVSPNHHQLIRPDGSITIGSCNDNTKTIYINDQLNKRLLKKVLCHEVTHAAMFSYDVYLEPSQEELFADIIATYGEEIIEITNRVFNKLRGGY